jgi:hypothetical protein
VPWVPGESRGRGIPGEFGVDLSVGTQPRAMLIDYSDIAYPTWANRRGPSSRVLLARMTRPELWCCRGSMGWSSAATLDANGDLSAPSETGHLRIDNIYFR